MPKLEVTRLNKDEIQNFSISDGTIMQNFFPR